MITVGIQDNIRLIGAEKNEKGTLIVKAEQGGDGGGSLMDMLSSSSSATQENGQDYYFWPLQEDDRLDNETDKYKDALNKLKVFRAQLNHILENYMVSTNIKWDPLKGLGFTADTDLINALTDANKRQPTLDKIYDNYSTQFIAQLNAGISAKENQGKLFRMKLPRTSKDKHFSSIPKFAPFMEPMEVGKNISKLKWSRYELGFRKGDNENGPYSGLNLSDPTPVPGAAAKTKGGNEQEVKDVDELFGN